MRKKFLVMMLAGLMAFSVTACGDSDSSDDKKSTTSKSDNADDADDADVDDSDDADDADVDDSDDADVDDADDADASDSEEFTLGDVSADMVDAALYTKDEDDSEVVLMLFTAPSGTQMCAIANLNADGTGDVVCGAYEAASQTDENGIDWTMLTFTDEYEGGEVTLGFVEDDAESYIMTPDGSAYAAERLDNEEAVNYMGTAIGLMQ